MHYYDSFKGKLWKDTFWSESYFISTTGGASIETLEQYIRDQGVEKENASIPAGQSLRSNLRFKAKTRFIPAQLNVGTGFSREKIDKKREKVLLFSNNTFSKNLLTWLKP